MLVSSHMITKEMHFVILTGNFMLNDWHFEYRLEISVYPL